MKRFILFGAPGSGKGTMGELIQRDFGYAKISTGDILRAEIERGSADGLRARSFMEDGGLVPDELVIELVRQRLERGDLDGGYVMDGYPRTLVQAEALTAVPSESERAIFLEVSEAEAIRRLQARLTCRECGAIYHRENKPPRQAGVCDVCGGAVEPRADDAAAAVRRRFRVYARRTLPVIRYYEHRQVLARVDGNGTAASVYERIRELIS
ncbi:MAG: nucleoside monophosphate kinase [Candidatus Aminicenantes bacterium]|nr:nucleoside monophosphate kinase [Candidatus Aminicenantes bacterium]